MLTQEEISRFQERGFLKSRRVIDDTTVDHLRAELERVIQDRGGTGPSPVHIVNLTRDDSAPVWQVVNIWQASEAFRNLMSHPTLLEETAQLSGAYELRIWHDQIQYKPAGHGGVNMWHQDNPLWPIIDPPTQVTAWVALDDVDESNGTSGPPACIGMRTMPGETVVIMNLTPGYRAADHLQRVPLPRLGH